MTSGIMSFISPNYLLIAIICEFGECTILSSTTYNLCKSLFCGIYDCALEIMYLNTGYNRKLLYTLGYINCIPWFFDINYKFFFLNILYAYSTNIDTKQLVMHNCLILSGMLSNFSLVHQLHNALLLHILIAYVNKQHVKYIITEIQSIINLQKQRLSKLYKNIKKEKTIKITIVDIKEPKPQINIFELPLEQFLDSISADE